MRLQGRSLLLILGASALILALALGFGATSEASREVILDLRLPRVLLAFAVGSALSVAGMILQAVFANPLCEPYTLGISSGAALGSVIAGSLGGLLSWSGFSLPALGGALIFALVLDRLATRHATTQVTLLLSGVMLGFVGSSLVSLWMALMDSAGLQGALLWLLGDLSRARGSSALISLAIGTLVTVYLWAGRGKLDAFLLGERSARALGVDIDVERRKLILLSSLLVAVAVSTSGMIGFVGLLVPHLARRIAGSLHVGALPLAWWLGGVILVLADLLARVMFRPHELPVGVITALAGAPVFVFILFTQSRRRTG